MLILNGTNEQIELQSGLLTTTVLNQYYFEADKKVKGDYTSPNVYTNTDDPIGGIKEDDKSSNEYKEDKSTSKNTGTYPEWLVSSPLACFKITQSYKKYHHALDITTKECSDKSIFALDNGKVLFAGWQSGYGYRIEIQHSNGFISTYSHLSKIKVKLNQEVLKGSIIGVMGSTGNSTGPHLHLEIIYNGVKIDPAKFLLKEV